MNEKEILRKILEGEESGLDELMKKYSQYISYVISGMLSKYPQDMDECINDVRLKLWNGLKKYNEDVSSLRTYIARISRNAALDRLRMIRYHEKSVDKNTQIDNEDIHYKNDSIEDTVIAKEMMKVLVNEIQKMKFAERDLYIRRYYYCQSIAQIARETGKTEKSVESKLARIKAKLKKKMREV